MSLRTSAPVGAPRRPRVHPAWWVAAVAFLALLGAAGFRGAPGALIVPLHHEFGWSMSVMSLAVSINLVLYGLVAPFAAALMDRFGIRQVVSAALLLVALGAGGSVFMTASWQLLVCWGLLIGTGTGAMALVFAATIANRWFVRRRGLVMGVLTAGAATGQLVILPPVAALADRVGWRPASLVIGGAALVVAPLVWWVLCDHPEDRGVAPYGADPGTYVAAPRTGGGAVRRAVDGLVFAARHRAFWALALAFAICGATTNGLVGIHFIPSAHDHGMPATTAAGLLAAVGVFDIAGTIASGWLTDKFDPRALLVGYYGFRGLSLLVLPLLLAQHVHPSMILFVVLYGLDWVATVPPTAALCRDIFGDRGTIVFGWVFASHQLGAAAAAFGAGVIRDRFGSYTYAWLAGAALCVLAAGVSVLARPPRSRPVV
ncbi:MFS transporter [Nocardia farcinica]|uniref:MFS transporter n=1 Tax=Nocardia farcinica TaxID=37329 RepID=UPI001895FE4B|nr:MFS transporter [Nocardia farcinica]MBF6140859.1 MFS transporter [Nocardia farcinica]MBF6384500.1 MFS transporter [Nocardia farcinica]